MLLIEVERRYLDPAAAADYLRLSRRTLVDKGWRERVGLKALRAGRKLVFDVGTLDEWVRRGANTTTPA